MRRPELLLSIFRLCFTASAVAAMAFQAGALQRAGVFRAGNFFSFFTIQSNILAAATLAAAALIRRSERTETFDVIRTAVTLYMAITGVVFAVLLSGLQESLDTHIEWVNFVVHTLMPVVIVADWLIDPPRHRFGPRAAALWLAYPAAWFAYTLLRGPHAHWYPYPFVDAARHGYGRVAVNAIVLVVCFAVSAALFALVGNLQSRNRGAGALT